MKKIRIIFGVLAILLAGTGVFANSFFATQYYRGAVPTNWSTVPTYDCSVLLPPSFASCDYPTDLQCQKYLQYVDPITEQTLTAVFKICKRVNNGDCEVVYGSFWI